MKRTLLLSIAVLVSITGIASADTFAEGTANEFDIDFVPISGATNPSSGYGIVNNDYRMGTYEITNDQFAKFAANSNVYWTGDDVPANMTSWYEAAQFVNYLNTSTGNPAAYKFSGSTFSVWDVTETDGTNLYRHKDAHYFLPSEDEWVKAAYWNGMSLQTYANALDGDLVLGFPDHAKWNYSSSSPWGIENGAMELNGTYNMMGNVWEWTESPFDNGDYISDGRRGIRGGAYVVGSSHLTSSQLVSGWPVYEEGYIGFRVASSVPEPCSLALLGLGGLVLRRCRA